MPTDKLIPMTKELWDALDEDTRESRVYAERVHIAECVGDMREGFLKLTEEQRSKNRLTSYEEDTEIEHVAVAAFSRKLYLFNSRWAYLESKEPWKGLTIMKSEAKEIQEQLVNQQGG